MLSCAARSQGARLGTEDSLYVMVDDGADCCFTPLYLSARRYEESTAEAGAA